MKRKSTLSIRHLLNARKILSEGDALPREDRLFWDGEKITVNHSIKIPKDADLPKSNRLIQDNTLKKGK